MSKTKMISMDTSTTKTGWAYFENSVYISSGVINLDTKESKKKYKNNTDLRIKDMCLNIFSLLNKYSPDIIVVEKLNVCRNMAVVRKLSKIIDIVYVYSIINNCTYYEIQPTQWRSKLGLQEGKKKREDFKQASINYIKETHGIDVGDDEADSICAGLGYTEMCSAD